MLRPLLAAIVLAGACGTTRHVDVYTGTPPSRRFAETGRLDEPSLAKLRKRAAALGCDAVLVTGTRDEVTTRLRVTHTRRRLVTRHHVVTTKRVLATCLVYARPAQ